MPITSSIARSTSTASRRPGGFRWRVHSSAAQECGGFVWIGLHEPSDEEISGLAAEFDLPPLAVEDAVNAHQRPKFERYGDTLFLAFKSTQLSSSIAELTVGSEVVHTGEVMLFVGANFVVSVRHGELGALHRIRARLEASPELLRRGPAAVIYAVADAIVDGHVTVADALEEDVDEIEAAVFAPRVGRDVERLYQVQARRARISAQRRAARKGRWPTCGRRRRWPAFVDELRDVDDHLQHVVGTGRRFRRAVERAARFTAGPGLRAAERRHAQDQRLGGHRRRPHDAGRHLRHELRPHARAALGSSAIRW